MWKEMPSCPYINLSRGSIMQVVKLINHPDFFCLIIKKGHMAIYYLEREGLTHNMPMYGHFYTPPPSPGTRGFSNRNAWHMGQAKSRAHSSVASACGAPRRFRLGEWWWGVRVNRQARSAPLSLSARAHSTAVIMWSCLLLLSLLVLPFYLSLSAVSPN